MAHDTCSICLDPIIHHPGGVLEPLGAAQCGHCFHCECFWRWEQARRQQDWRRGVASRGCPCPVCNVPVREFIKLFIDADATEVKKLKKELKLVKCKLARDRIKLERTKKELCSMKQADRTETSPPTSTSSRSPRKLDSSRAELEKDIQELVATAALLLGDPPPPKVGASGRATPYRRHESCPLSSMSFPETRSIEENLPDIPVSISMPPAPQFLSRRQSRRRSAEDAPQESRRRSHSSRHQQCYRGGPPTLAPSESQSSQSDNSVRVIERPDPPTPLGGNPIVEFRSGGGASVSSLSSPSINSVADPPSCRTLDSDSVQVIHRVAYAPPTPVRRQLINFFGIDPPVVQGLLGGCIYMD